MFGKRESAREFIGIERVGEGGLVTADGGEMVFFSIKPANLSTLSEDSIRAKIYALMTVLKGVTDVEFLCVNSRESFDGNKRFLRSRLDDEDNPAIRRLLELDAEFLDRVQAQTATAREFFVVVRQAGGKPRGLGAAQLDEAYLSGIEKSLSEQGFAVKRYDSDDLKRLLAVYFEQNVTSDRFEDFDGERWVAR